MRKSQSVQDESRIKLNNKDELTQQHINAPKPSTSTIAVNGGVLLSPSRTFDASRFIKIFLWNLI